MKFNIFCSLDDTYLYAGLRETAIWFSFVDILAVGCVDHKEIEEYEQPCKSSRIFVLAWCNPVKVRYDIDLLCPVANLEKSITLDLSLSS